MRNAFVAAAILLYFSLPAFAGFELSLGAGYGLPAGGVLVETKSTWDDNYLPYGKYTELEHSYVSLGNGLKIDVDVTYFVNENLGIMLASGYSTGGGFSTENTYIDTSMTPSVLTDKMELSASYLPINLGLKLRVSLGSVSPYVYVAPGVYLIMAAEETGEDIGDKWTETYKLDPGFGFSGGLGVLISASEKVGFRIEVNSNYAFAAINETERETTDKVTGAKTTDITKYYNDKTDLKDPVTNGTTTTDEDAGKFQLPFSSISFKAGVVIGF